MEPSDLTHEEWEIIRPLLPNKPRGVPRVDDRRALNGILFILRTNTPWRNLPERYGPYTTIYNRYSRWAAIGVWHTVTQALTAQASTPGIHDATIKAFQDAASKKQAS